MSLGETTSHTLLNLASVLLLTYISEKSEKLREMNGVKGQLLMTSCSEAIQKTLGTFLALF
jgi:hypothetical protein